MLAREPSTTYVERKTRQAGGLASNISLVIRYNKIELQKELFKGFLLAAECHRKEDCRRFGYAERSGHCRNLSREVCLR